MKANEFVSHLRMLLAAALLSISTDLGIATDEPVQAIPRISMNSVGLTDAIRNLARQAGMNFILDPNLSGPSVDSDGKVIPTPLVTARYENISAKDALLALLKEHDLQLVENPVTTVKRITRSGQTAKPVDPKWVTGDTNGIIPLVVMDDVPLDAAIQNLAGKGQLKVVIDPTVSNPPFVPGSRAASRPMISVRWEKITARQAIAALVENYDLVLKVNADSNEVSISPRKPTNTGSTPLNPAGVRGQ